MCPFDNVAYVLIRGDGLFDFGEIKIGLYSLITGGGSGWCCWCSELKTGFGFASLFMTFILTTGVKRGCTSSCRVDKSPRKFRSVST